MRRLGLGALAGAWVIAACASDPVKGSESAGGSGGGGAMGGGVNSSPGAAGEAESASGSPAAGSGGMGGELPDVPPVTTDGGAAGGGGAGGAGGAPEEPIDGPVVGVVLAGLEPVAGLAVVLDGATTLTAADGSFAFPDAPTTYSLIVVDAAGKAASVLDDMSRRRPVVQFPGVLSASRFAHVLGKFSNAGSGSTDLISAAFVSDTRGTLATYVVPSSQPGYDLGLKWTGATTQSGKVAALVSTPGGFGCPASYSGYAEAKLDVAAGDTIGDQVGTLAATNLAFAPLAGERTLEGKVTAPPGYDLDDFHLDVAPFSYTFFAPNAGAFSCSVPQDPALPTSARFAAKLLSQQENAITLVSRVVPPSGDLDVELPAASLPVLPITGATGVTLSTPFSWTAAAPGVISRIRFNLVSWTIWRITKANATTIPDLSAYGVPFPKGLGCYWLVGGFGPATTVDQAAALPLERNSVGFADYISTTANDRVFTTAN